MGDGGVIVISLSAILAPVDFSSGSRFVVEYAVAMAHAFQASVTLLHVCQRADSMSGIVPGADKAVDDKEDVSVARKSLDGLRADHMNRDVRVLVLDGSPAHEIVSAARSFQMVIMGSHGRTGLRRVLMGSVAEAVVRGATCPVLTMHFPSPDGAPSLERRIAAPGGRPR
jgi:nucleotide-binding universal stress UspA family protein